MSSSPVFNLAFAAAIGVVMVSVATRIKVPSIALLLLTGIAVGPEGLGILRPDALGRGLPFVVGMAVAIILFEGGLTLDLAGARRSPRVIRRMLTLGVLITWLGTAATVWWLLDLRPSVALLCGSLVIVTGPTVISPILRRLPVRERLKHILYWEAVLVDAIGVFVAVLCLEWLSPHAGGEALDPLARFGLRLALGGGVGVAAGAIMALLLRHHLIHEEQVNIFVLAMALLAYGVCEAVLHESGILAVIIAGLIVGATKPRYLDDLKRFKLELTDLGVGMLFVLLAARLQLARFFDYGWAFLAAIVVVIFVLRPLVVLTATAGHRFSVQEKLFLSWMGPRGIVAAFMASLFALQVGRDPALATQAPFLETFSFAVIGITVMIEGLSAPWVVRLLGLETGQRRTWLVVGDLDVARALATGLRAAGARALGLAPVDNADEPAPTDGHVLQTDPMHRELLDDPRLADVGRVLCVSANPQFDHKVCERWAGVLGPAACFHAAHDGADHVDGEPIAGVPVWKGGPDPSALLHGIEAGALAVDAVEIAPGEDPDRFGAAMTPLFWVDQAGNAEIWSDEHLYGDAAGTAVVVHRHIPGLADLIVDAIVVEDEQVEYEAVVDRLLAQAAAHQPDLVVDALKRSIIERERSMPTAMGSGVAMPHAYCAEVTRSQCYVANARHGLAVSTPDSEPVRLVFLVLSPVGKAEEHLRSLASLAQLVHDRGFASFLERQPTREQLLARIRERA